MKRYEPTLTWAEYSGERDVKMSPCPEGGWIPADVGRALYEALDVLVKAGTERAINGYEHIPARRNEQNARSLARKALSLADGEKDNG